MLNAVMMKSSIKTPLIVHLKFSQKDYISCLMVITVNDILDLNIFFNFMLIDILIISMKFSSFTRNIL